jgi:hypothetical protein
MIVGNLAMVIVFYLVFSSRLPAWLRYPLAIGLSALSRYMVIHIPAVTFIHMPPTIGVQLLQLLIAVVSGVLAILISSRLRRWGIQDFHTLKLKRAISQ